MQKQTEKQKLKRRNETRQFKERIKKENEGKFDDFVSGSQMLIATTHSLGQKCIKNVCST